MGLLATVVPHRYSTPPPLQNDDDDGDDDMWLSYEQNYLAFL
jgi:hypothetical protein